MEKKIVVTKAELTGMCDRDLILYYKYGFVSEKNGATEVLIKRYKPQIDKYWRKLMAECGNIYYAPTFKDDFTSEAYMQLIKAADNVNLDILYNDKWLFVSYYGLYLSNLRHKFRNMLINNYSSLKSTDAYTNDAENEDSPEVDFEAELQAWGANVETQSTENIFESKQNVEKINGVINSCYNKWSEFNKNVFDCLKSGMKKKEIATKLNTSVANVYHASNYLRSYIEERAAI